MNEKALVPFVAAPRPETHAPRPQNPGYPLLPAFDTGVLTAGLRGQLARAFRGSAEHFEAAQSSLHELSRVVRDVLPVERRRRASELIRNKTASLANHYDEMQKLSGKSRHRPSRCLQSSDDFLQQVVTEIDGLLTGLQKVAFELGLKIAEPPCSYGIVNAKRTLRPTDSTSFAEWRNDIRKLCAELTLPLKALDASHQHTAETLGESLKLSARQSLAAVDAVSDSSTAPNGEPRFYLDLDLQEAKGKVCRRGWKDEVKLPFKEWELLKVFLQHKDGYVKKSILMTTAWDDPPSEGTVYTTISNLRTRLATLGVTIENGRGFGYRLTESMCRPNGRRPPRRR